MEVLIVEDEIEKAILLQEYLQFFNCKSIISKSVNNAMNLIEKNNFPIIFLDYNLPDGKGVEVLKRSKELGQNPVFVLNSSDEEANMNYRKLGFDSKIDDYSTLHKTLVNIIG